MYCDVLKLEVFYFNKFIVVTPTNIAEGCISIGFKSASKQFMNVDFVKDEKSD